MKGRVQGLIAGILIGATLTGSVFAKVGTETIKAAYNNIKIYVDGVKIDPKGVDGSSTEPFIYNGTTYLPVRAVGEAIGKTVTWDGATQSVYLGEKPGDKQYLVDVCPPYDGKRYKVYSSTSGEFLQIGGKKYTNAFSLGETWYSPNMDTMALFRLDGKYNKLSFEIGRVDDAGFTDATLNIYLDGKLTESYDLKAEDLLRAIEIDLNGALQLKMELLGGQMCYGVVNAIVE